MSSNEKRIAWTSPQQAAAALAKLGVNLSRHTPKGALSVSEDALAELRGQHPIVDTLLEYRHAVKLLGMARTFSDFVEVGTWEIHAEFLQAGAPTGRFASRNPNMQQVPESLRAAFVARPGTYFLSADFEAIELRILAACAKEMVLIEAFRSGLDPHAKTASVMLGVSLDQVTPDQRSLGKTLNYATLYGTGASGLARRLGVSGRRAKELLHDYFRAVPALTRFLQHLQDQAEIQGYVESYFGRRRPLPEIHSDHPKLKAYGLRSAVNGFAQGTASDVMKGAMLRLGAALPHQGAHMLLTLHDAALLEIPNSVPPKVIVPSVKAAMETTIEGVPLTVSVSWGPNWGQLASSEA